MGDLVNQFRWSFSRQSVFEVCKRRYYYRYYAHWGGWKWNAAAEAQLCYRLGKMKTLPMLIGTIVHNQIRTVLMNVQQGRGYSREGMQEEAARMLAKEIRNSENKLWKNDPKRNANLFEHYYQWGIPAEAVKSAEERVIGCLERFFSSGVLDVIGPTDLQGWRVEQGTGWEIGGIPVLAYLDFAVAMEGRLVIYDWKTGKADGGYDTQLGVYGLAAHEAWGYPAEQVALRLLYLGDGALQEHAFGEAQAAEARRTIVDGAREMLGMLDDQAKNTARRDAFPMTADLAQCEWCFFRELCFDPRTGVRRDMNGQVQ